MARFSASRVGNWGNFVFSSTKILLVRAYNIWQRSADKFEELSRFTAAIQQRAKERKQRLGRILPMPWEIVKVLRQFKAIYRQQKQFISPGELLPPAGFVVPSAHRSLRCLAVGESVE
jgi:hypothetical protein